MMYQSYVTPEAMRIEMKKMMHDLREDLESKLATEKKENDERERRMLRKIDEQTRMIEEQRVSHLNRSSVT